MRYLRVLRPLAGVLAVPLVLALAEPAIAADESVQSPVKVRRQAPPPQVLTAAEVAEYNQSVAKEAAHPVMHRRLGAIIADIKAAPLNQRNPLIQEYLHAVSDLDPAAAQAAMRSLVALWKRG